MHDYSFFCAMNFRCIVLLVFVALYGPNARTQVPPLPPTQPSTADGADNEKVFKYVEQSATFRGNVGTWLSDRLVYPDFAQLNGITGKTYIQFIIDENGHVTNPEILTSSYPILDQEALRVVRDMPQWEPGKNNGQPVKSYFTLPIVFALEPDNLSSANALDTCSRAFSTNRSSLFSHFPAYSGRYDELQQVHIPLKKDEVAVTVYIAVTISKTGQIMLPHVLCSLNDAYVEEVLSAFKLSMAAQNSTKKWKPARSMTGAATECVMVIPVNAISD